jgi:hypothetical protein
MFIWMFATSLCLFFIIVYIFLLMYMVIFVVNKFVENLLLLDQIFIPTNTSFLVVIADYFCYN